jgi:hypothetical protein
MALPQIVRKGGSVNGPVSIGRIHWMEPVKGVLRITDGSGNTLATLSYSGTGQGPDTLIFNPPLQSSSGITVHSPGGDAHVYLTGPSGFGY